MARRKRCEIPLLTPSPTTSRTATVVASEPVPDVVGTATCAISGPPGLRPPPIGGLTYSITSPPWVAIRLAALAVSMVEPPPIDRKPS